MTLDLDAIRARLAAADGSLGVSVVYPAILIGDIEALLARVAELEAELANERGEGEPPSAGWIYEDDAGRRWTRPGWTVYRLDDGVDWQYSRDHGDWVSAPTARAAMKAADVKAKEEV